MQFDFGAERKHSKQFRIFTKKKIKLLIQFLKAQKHQIIK
jgi:hypothetical protein